MKNLNDYWGSYDDLVQHMNGEKDKAYIIEERELVSYQWVVIGAKTREEALQNFSDGEKYDDVSSNDGRKITVHKIDGSWEWHKTYAPKINGSFKFKKCELNAIWDCEKVVDQNKNVCQTCLDYLKDKKEVSA